MKEKPNPWFIGFVLGGGIVVATIVMAIWFPNVPEPLGRMIVMGGMFCIAILIATFWRFLSNWRFWVPLAFVICLDAVCVETLFDEIRKLSMWHLDFIMGFELFATMVFLSWFLDTNKKHHDRHSSDSSMRD